MKQLKNKLILATFISCNIILLFSSCQKKFDPKSYAPAETFSGYSASNQIAPTNLVGYWAFNGNLLDSTSLTSAVNSGTSFGSGVKGQCLNVGLNNYATFIPTTAIKNLQSMTLSYWVNTSMNSIGIQEPVGFVNNTQFWSNFEMFFDGQTASSAVCKIHAFSNGGASEIWLTNWSLTNPWGVWNHIVLTYDASSTTLSFYNNGQLIGSSIQTGAGNLNFTNFSAIVFGTAQFETTPSLTSGAGAQSWASFLLGSLDEVRIYNKALTTSEISALHKLELLGK